MKKKTTRKQAVRRKTRKKRTTRRAAGAAGRRRRRPAQALSQASTAEIRGELQRRQRQVATLERKRDRLLTQAQAIEERIAVLNGQSRSRTTGRTTSSGRVTGRRRARNKLSLVAALRKTLTKKTMSVAEAAAAVRKGGYRTTSGNFRVIVNQTLLANPKAFRKVARGRYTARG